MNSVKKIIIGSIAGFVISLLPVILLFVGVVGVVMGFSSTEDKEIVTNYEMPNTIRNNQIYSSPYKRVLNKYLTSKGYVSLERLVFYLQMTNNVLDVSTLNDTKWNEAYLFNLNETEKQMKPIAEICSGINTSSITIKSDNKLDVINLCEKVPLESNYKEMPFSFPLHNKFIVTSYTNEERTLGWKTDVHNGWDFAVPIGTNFYSICDGTISKIVNTQTNDLPYSKSHNKIGNYVMVKCNNGLTSIYYHIKYKSSPKGLKEGSKVSKNDLLGKTSTTGESSGPHLHLGLKDVNKNILDPMDYIDMKTF